MYVSCADLEELANGELRDDHPPFQDFYATPIRKVSGHAGKQLNADRSAIIDRRV